MHFFLPNCVFCIDYDICPRFQSLNQNCFSSQHSAILLSTQTVLCTDFSRHFACLWSKIAVSASPTPSIQYHVDLLYCYLYCICRPNSLKLTQQQKVISIVPHRE